MKKTINKITRSEEEKREAKESARETNRLFSDNLPAIYGPEAAGKLANINKAERKKGTYWRRDIRQVADRVTKHLNYAAKNMQEMATPEGLIVFKTMEIATRDNNNPTIWCPDCKQHHPVEVCASCPKTGKEYPVYVPSAQMEKNSLQAMCKMMDKLFSNKHELSGSIKIEGQMVQLTDAIVNVIMKYVSPDRKKACVQEIANILENAEDAEFEEITEH